MSTLPKVADDPGALVGEKAREALAKAKGNLSTAVRTFRRWIDNDDRLRRALTDPLIDSAIEVALGAVMREGRASSWRSGLDQRPDRATTDGALQRMAGRNLSELLRYALPETYKPLGEATRKEVLAAVGYYASMRRGFGKRERWLSLVAAALPDDSKHVRSVLGERDLQNLQTRAEREVEKES